jgi:single stranded DNA-binding protein
MEQWRGGSDASDNFTVQVGNLTDDPELRFTQNGTPVANFRLAVNQRVKQDDGSWRESTWSVRCALARGRTTLTPASLN